MRLFVFAILSGLLPLTAQAQAFTAENRLVVIPTNSTDFEVIEARGEGARGIWCAAADFALRHIPQTPHQRLYVKSPRGPSITGVGKLGVVFTTTTIGTEVPGPSYSVTVRRAGASLPVQHAYRFCLDPVNEPDDLLFR